jgi:SSS family solute:Na+ symporter/sodium/pantothenate symporter
MPADATPPAPQVGPGTLAALLLVIGVSVWLGVLAERAIRRKSFLKGYFLGDRGLGVWVLALTATVQSGGTFMGFPSLVYSHGWVVALFIASYMVVPITGFGILGKRLAQLSRQTDAITVPDIFRERFASPAVGLVSSLLILFFMAFLMIAQFKAGAILMKLSWPGDGSLSLSDEAPAGLGAAYYVGLTVFTVTVVGYTLWGGFLASAWTDLFQSLLMLAGVLILLGLALPAAGGLEAATLKAMENTSPAFAFGPGYAADGRHFLTGPLALSFFFLWTFGGLGSPPGMVRIMACKDSRTIRRSIIVLSVYNAFIYIPLIMICICGRALIGDLQKQTDEIIPRLALSTTASLPGGSFLAGIILAAPFGAVMATVSTYLVVLASGLVRDVYQRFVKPDAGARQLRRVTFGVMLGLGALGLAANLDPPDYLQVLIIFSSSGQAATFVVPALMVAFWRRATAAGAIAAMVAGAAAVLGLFLAGLAADDPMVGPATRFRSYFLVGFDPVLWGFVVSAAAGIGVSLMTQPPAKELVSRLFDARP